MKTYILTVYICIAASLYSSEVEDMDSLFYSTGFASHVRHQPYCYKNPASSVILNTLRGN